MIALSACRLVVSRRAAAELGQFFPQPDSRQDPGVGRVLSRVCPKGRRRRSFEPLTVRLQGRFIGRGQLLLSWQEPVSIDDEHVRVWVTVPDTHHVTGEDVERGRLLADAVARYVAELEKRAAISKDAAGAEAAA
jgi:hypothetical protein